MNYICDDLQLTVFLFLDGRLSLHYVKK